MKEWCQNCCPVLELYYNLSSSLTYFITGFDSLSWFVYMLNCCSIDQCFSIILIVGIFGNLNSVRAFQTSRPFKVILPRHLRPIFLHSLVITTSFQPNATCSVLSRLRTVTSLPHLVSRTKKHCSFIMYAWNHYQTKSPFPVAVFCRLQSVDELLEFLETWGYTISFATCQPVEIDQCTVHSGTVVVHGVSRWVYDRLTWFTKIKFLSIV